MAALVLGCGSGPAGGIIFSDKGNGSEGWRYLPKMPETLRGERNDA
jgi:hypothetical protein